MITRCISVTSWNFTPVALCTITFANTVVLVNPPPPPDPLLSSDFPPPGSATIVRFSFCQILFLPSFENEIFVHSSLVSAVVTC